MYRLKTKQKNKANIIYKYIVNTYKIYTIQFSYVIWEEFVHALYIYISINKIIDIRDIYRPIIYIVCVFLIENWPERFTILKRKSEV